MLERRLSYAPIKRLFNNIFNIFELFFCKKKYLLVGASGMLWTGQWVSE